MTVVCLLTANEITDFRSWRAPIAPAVLAYARPARAGRGARDSSSKCVIHSLDVERGTTGRRRQVPLTWPPDMNAAGGVRPHIFVAPAANGTKTVGTERNSCARGVVGRAHPTGFQQAQHISLYGCSAKHHHGP